jgi:nucleotide-binding universal stress UspA family protein
VFDSIVVGTDGSETAIQAVRQAVEIAGTLNATLEFVSAYPSGRRGATQRDAAPHDPEDALFRRQQVDALLSDAAALAASAGVSVHTHAREGDPAQAIIEVAESEKADLIIVGNKGMAGAKRFLLGSVPNKVSHHAPCSVLIVRTT